MKDLINNKIYTFININKNPSIFRDKFYDIYSIPEDVLVKLSRDLGFSINLYYTLSAISEDAADSLVSSMSVTSKHTIVCLLVDTEEHKVVGYSLESDRVPVLNYDFMNKVESLSETCEELSLDDIYYSADDTISSVIFKLKTPFRVYETYQNKEAKEFNYDVGILVVNDETNSVYTRLVLYINGQPLYLPASYYNATNSRYRRSTGSSLESLEVLILKVIEDLRDGNIKDKMQEFHYRYRYNKEIIVSYEEYNTLMKCLRRIPTVIEDTEIITEISEKYNNFEKEYLHLDDKKSSYIWRCTALGSMTINELVSLTSHTLTDLRAPSMEYFRVRELLGAYISTNRIAEEIAQKDIE